MGGIIDVAGAVLARSNARAGVAAQNIANMSTPGFKAQESFESLIDDVPGLDLLASSRAATLGSTTSNDWKNGNLIVSHNPLDMAITDNGFFVVRSGDTTFYTRAGHFSRDGDGHLVTADGQRLQGDGGDISLTGDKVTIDQDGTVHDGEQSSQRISLIDFTDRSALIEAGNGLYTSTGGSGFAVPSPNIRQGMLESSNVSQSNEMITLMKSLREAETGQRVAQLYDDLMSEAATSFGQGAG